MSFPNKTISYEFHMTYTIKAQKEEKKVQLLFLYVLNNACSQQHVSSVPSIVRYKWDFHLRSVF